MDSPSGRLGRWKMRLQQYEFDIKYRRGSANQVADALSRQPEVCQIDEQPRCRWYRRIMQQTRERPEEAPDYAIRQGRLVRHLLHDLDFREVPAAHQWKDCVPTEQRSHVMQQYHDEPTAGHLGIAKTIARIARLYYWPGMFRDITKYVRNCRNCQAHKAEQVKPAGLMHASACHAPWKQVAVDLIGPLPRSTQGHTWLLTMQDRFSKWLEMKPLRKATASAVTRTITNKIVYRHGCPDTLISDNSTQFKSEELKKALESFGIRHRTTPVYTPQCNPVERTNRVIKTMISQFVGKNHKKWDERLAALQFAYNSAKHDATGFSPAYVTQGRKLPGPHVTERRKNPAAETPERTHRKLKELHELVRINLARSFHRQSRHYDLRRREWRPQVGDHVWKREHHLSDKQQGFNAKLAPRYVGPLEVRRVISPVIYDLRDDRHKWYRHVHIKDMKRSLEDNDEPTEEERLDIDAAGPSDDTRRRLQAPTTRRSSREASACMPATDTHPTPPVAPLNAVALRAADSRRTPPTPLAKPRYGHRERAR